MNNKNRIFENCNMQVFKNNELKKIYIFLLIFDRQMRLTSSQKPIYVNPVMIILFIIIVNIIPNRDFVYSMNKELDSQEYV